jgi:N utilization substance protein A
MDANESNKPDPVVRPVVQRVGRDGKLLPITPTENPNPDHDPDSVWRVLRKHVPEMKSGAIRVLGLARRPGKRSAIAVASKARQIGDPVGMFVGERGSRAKAIVAELGGEKMDVIRWDDSTERFLANLLAPLRVMSVSFDESTRRAKVSAERVRDSHTTDLELRANLLMEARR